MWHSLIILSCCYALSHRQYCSVALYYCPVAHVQCGGVVNLVSIEGWLLLLLQLACACRAIFGVSRETMCILCGLI